MKSTRKLNSLAQAAFREQITREVKKGRKDAASPSPAQGNNTVTVRSLYGEEAHYLLEKYAQFGACVVTVGGLTDAEVRQLMEKYPIVERGSTENFG